MKYELRDDSANGRWHVDEVGNSGARKTIKTFSGNDAHGKALDYLNSL